MRKTILLSIFISSIVYSINLQSQCVSGNCENGRGIYIYPSGAKYIGEFVGGEIHGIGTCYYTDGSKYQGQWIHRYPHGEGVKIYPNGSRWKGQWNKGKPVAANGKVMEEDLVYKGATTSDGTNIQTGCISGDCKNGLGTFAYADGSKYTGRFENGNLQGKGIWYYPNGDRYEGNFQNNYQHGEGAIISADGKYKSGWWEAGEFRSKGFIDFGAEGCRAGNCTEGQGTYVYEGGAAQYSGQFKDGLPHGQGQCLYANGEKYKGWWQSGRFEGLGTLTLVDGSEVKGHWYQGVFQAKPIKKEPSSGKNKLSSQELPAEDVYQRAKNMRVWAVIIGISNYNHMPVLRYTDDDAYRMYAFLKSPEGGALKDQNMRILIDEDATKANITSTMKEVFSQAGPHDLILLYFSGHGLRGSFLPIDFDGFNNKLLHEEVNEILENSRARYKLCIADACHSGSLFNTRGNSARQTLIKYYETLAQAKPGTALIMSSKSEETSLESSGLRQGVFSHFLIRGLKGEADTDGNHIVTVEELFNFINENVRSYTAKRQSPVMQGDFDKSMTVSVVRE